MKKNVLFFLISVFIVLITGCSERKDVSKNNLSSTYDITDQTIREESTNIQKTENTENKEGMNFGATISKNEVKDLTEEEIVKRLFSIYLKYYSSLSVNDNLKLDDYRVIEVRKENNVPNDMKNLMPIYRVIFSVQGYMKGSSWGAGNGEIKEDGWVIGKSLYVRIIREKELFRLVFIGTGL